jgi:predicted amidophosphoribosyltransferase
MTVRRCYRCYRPVRASRMLCCSCWKRLLKCYVQRWAVTKQRRVAGGWRVYQRKVPPRR